MGKFVLSMDQSIELILREPEASQVRIRQKDGQEYWATISRMWREADMTFVQLKDLDISPSPNGMIIRTDRLESITLVWEREGGWR